VSGSIAHTATAPPWSRCRAACLPSRVSSEKPRVVSAACADRAQFPADHIPAAIGARFSPRRRSPRRAHRGVIGPRSRIPVPAQRAKARSRPSFGRRDGLGGSRRHSPSNSARQGSQVSALGAASAITSSEFGGCRCSIHWRRRMTVLSRRDGAQSRDGLAQFLRGRCDQDYIPGRGRGDIVITLDARLHHFAPGSFWIARRGDLGRGWRRPRS